MSSNASTAESGVSTESAVPRIDTTDFDADAGTRTQFDVEREILCNYIAELEAELTRERRRREQVVEHYERLLEVERNAETESTGLLRRLF